MTNIYFALSLISAATLAFQVALTRFFSLAQGHHFAFMAVSLALLGIGASGTYLSLRRPTEASWRRTFTAGAILFSLSLPAAYLTINYLPFDAYRIAWEPTQLLWLVLYYLALTVPFFFSGLAVGVVLAVQPARAGPIYGANLLGAGLGPPLALLALATVGGPGTVFACALLGWLSAISSHWSEGSSRLPSLISPNSNFLPPLTRYALRFFLYSFVAIALLYLTLHPPPFSEVRLTPYKSLSQVKLYPDAEVVYSRWNAFSRVDVLRSQSIRSAPGLSFTYPGDLPPQLGLTIDGDNLSPITNPTQPDFTQYLPLSLGFALRPAADALILEPSGGLAVLTALQNGVRSVTVVQSNHTAVAVVSHHFADFTGHLYDDPRVTVMVDEPRSFLSRTEQQFDLIILPLTDSFRPVTAGAYTLSEDYRYTVETFVNALAHLSPNGLLVAERWLQLPPSESLRLWGTMAESMRRLNDDEWVDTDSAAHLLALRSLQTSLVIGARSPLSAQDIAKTRDFANTRQFDLVWLPDIQPDEANRFSIVPDAIYYHTFVNLLRTPNPTSFFASYPHAVAPPTDDHPFFFHFFKWQQTPEILQTLGKTWQPFGGSGYLVLVILLILTVILSAGLILVPLLWHNDGARTAPSGAGGMGGVTPSSNIQPNETRDFTAVDNSNIKNSSHILHAPPSSLRVRYLLYFVLLGLGFLFVEITLLQRFILYLGQPAYAFAVVLSALLAGGGIGSGYFSKHVALRIALPLITLLTISYPLLLPYFFDTTLRFPFVGRVIMTILIILPLGAMLGIPFPRGLVLVGRTTPRLAPWVWAVNGCASVVSAVLAAMIALTWGFSAVLWGAALTYILAGLVVSER